MQGYGDPKPTHSDMAVIPARPRSRGRCAGCRRRPCCPARSRGTTGLSRPTVGLRQRQRRRQRPRLRPQLWLRWSRGLNDARHQHPQTNPSRHGARPFAGRPGDRPRRSRTRPARRRRPFGQSAWQPWDPIPTARFRFRSFGAVSEVRKATPHNRVEWPLLHTRRLRWTPPLLG